MAQSHGFETGKDRFLESPSSSHTEQHHIKESMPESEPVACTSNRALSVQEGFTAISLGKQIGPTSMQDVLLIVDSEMTMTVALQVKKRERKGENSQ